MKRKALTMLLLMAVALGVTAGNEVLINGNKADKDAAKLEFEGDKAMVAFSDGSTFEYDMEEVEIVFTKTTSPLSNASFFQLSSIVKDELQISGLKGGETLKVFNTLGEILINKKAESENVTLDLKGTANGVYLLKIDNQSIKFIKK